MSTLDCPDADKNGEVVLEFVGHESRAANGNVIQRLCS